MLSVLLLSSHLWAHGEDEPGPHGGHIRMPGTFHTELLLNSDQSLLFYLLDMNFKNPIVKDSSVEVHWELQGKDKVSFDCSVMDNHFHCTPKGKYDANSGKLIVKASRGKSKGSAVYNLPLGHDQKGGGKAHSMDHSHH